MSTKTQKSSATPVAVIGPGSILSETSFYVVQSVDPHTGKVVVLDDHGHSINLSQRYVNEITVSADVYASEEKKTMTELAEIFINNPRMAMTVAFITKPEEKSKKDYEFEKNSKIQEITNASLANAATLLNDLIENPISRTTPGQLRIIKGRHYGHNEESIKLGRLSFIDMEEKKDTSKGYDTRTRKVDPRSIQWLIVNNVKYILK